LYLIFSDLDGTLLDHHSYDWRPASEAIHALRQRRFPLILISSKTRPEIQALQTQMQLDAPFVSENGAAIFYPPHTFHQQLPDAEMTDGLMRAVAGKSRAEILPVINELRDQHGYDFVGFNDWGAAGIAADSGLSLEAAALANQRDASEPLLWRDSDLNMQAFQQQLAAHGLITQQGGRYLQVQGKTSKADALHRLREHYQSDTGEACKAVALGDGPNDLAMLAAANIAVVIRAHHAHSMALNHAQLIRTDQYGPQGWNEAVLSLLNSEIQG